MSAMKGAVQAAQKAGELIRRNHRRPKTVHAESQHDLKLELDVRCQKLIERALHATLPQAALLGEEGIVGNPEAEWRWVVDPIDGTVNFAYGIPHACVSIALQRRPSPSESATLSDPLYYQTVLGVVLDPFVQELWTALHDGPARLNGRPVQVSQRPLNRAIIAMGFAKTRRSLNATLPAFTHYIHRVRKIRILGAAALDLCYVATGRLDAFLESGLRIWDIAAGGLILERAGGKFIHAPLPTPYAYRVRATSAKLDRTFRRHEFR